MLIAWQSPRPGTEKCTAGAAAATTAEIGTILEHTIEDEATRPTGAVLGDEDHGSGVGSAGQGW